jgi:hypothetical protein
LYSKVVNVLASTGGGTQDITFTPNGSDPSWTPKVAIVQFNRAVSSTSAWIENQAYGIGFTDGTNSKCVAVVSEDNSASADTAMLSSSDAIITTLVPSGTVNAIDCKATFNSWLTNGMRISWSDAPAAQFYMTVLFLGGSDITDATVGTFTNPNTTGNHSVTTLAYQPDFAMFLTANTSSDNSAVVNSCISVGAATSSSDQWCQLGTTTDNATTMSTRQMYATNRISLSGSPSSITGEASFVSFNSNGFTINIPDAYSSTIHYLLMKGGSYTVGSDTEPAATGNQTITTNHDVKAVAMFGLDTGTSGSLQTGFMWSGGFADNGINQYGHVFEDTNGSANAIVVSAVDGAAHIYNNITANATANSTTWDDSATINSMTSTTFVINWDNIGQARPFRYIAFGNGVTLTQVTQTRTHKYNILSKVTQSRTHVYNIIGKVSGSKTHKYNILQKIQLSKTHKYNLLNQITKTTNHLYNIIVKVTKTYTHKYNIIGRITESNTHKYNIVAKITATRTHLYNLLNSVSSGTKTHKYNIIEQIESSKTHLYNIIGRVTASKTHKYNIEEPVTQVTASKTHKYNILNAVSASKTHLYNIIGKVSTTKTHLYNITGKVTSTKTHLYNVVRQVTASKVHLYNVIGKVTTTKTHKYNILNSVSTSKTHKYNILEQVEATKTHKYNIIEQIEASKTHKYNVEQAQGTVSTTKTHKYHVEGKVQTTKTHLYNLLNRVTASKTHKYNVTEQIENTKTHLYNVTGKVTTTKTHLFNVVRQVTASKIHVFNVIAKVTVTKTHLYNLLTALLTTKTHKYDVIGKVTSSKTHKYNVEEAEGQVSATKTHKYNIEAPATEVTTTKTHLYDILAEVTTTKTHKSDILDQVTRSRTHKYNIVGKISTTKTHKYNLIQKITKTTTHKSDILVKVSPPLTKTHKFNSIALVQRSRTHKYNLVGRLYTSRTHRYRMGGKVRLTKTHIFDVGIAYIPEELGGSTHALIKFPERVRIIDIIADLNNTAIANIEIPVSRPPRDNIAIATVAIAEYFIITDGGFRLPRIASTNTVMQHRVLAPLITPRVISQIQNKAICNHIGIQVIPPSQYTRLHTKSTLQLLQLKATKIYASTQINPKKEPKIKIAASTMLQQTQQTRVESKAQLEIQQQQQHQQTPPFKTIAPEIMTKQKLKTLKSLINLLSNDRLFE